MVAQHKTADVFCNDVYIPIHVGKALSSVDLGIQADNTGDNISDMNPYYCELTAQYWGWKNLDCEYIGLCHYRRYFEKEVTKENIDFLMSDCDIILTPELHHNQQIINKLHRTVQEEDVVIFKQVFSKLYPEYEEAAVKFMYGNIGGF